MKRYYPAAVLATALFVCTGAAQSPAQSTKSYKRYGVQSCIVEYSLGGSQSGTETLYFDRYGMREARYANKELSVLNVKQKQNTLVLTDFDWTINIDLDKKTGTKTKNTVFQEMVKNAKDDDVIEMGMKMLKDMGGVKVGTEKVAGKTCDVWEVKKLGSKTWLWNAIPLKTVAKFAGVEIQSVATKVQEGASIPESKFQVPAKITLTEGMDVGTMLKNRKKKTK